MAKQTWIKDNDVWKKVQSAWANVNGDWKKDVMPKGVVSGGYKEFMSYLSIYCTVGKLVRLNSNGNVERVYGDYDTKEVTVNPNGYIYIQNSTGDGITKLTSEGELIWESSKLSGEDWIDVSPEDEILMRTSSRVKKLNKTGEEEWEKIIGYTRKTPAVNSFGEVFIMRWVNSMWDVIKLDIENGSLIYSKYVTHGQVDEIRVDPNGHLIVIDWDGQITRVNRRTGATSVLHKYKYPQVQVSVGGDGSIYTRQYRDYAPINKLSANGNPIWQLNSPSSFDFYDVEASPDGSIYVSTRKRINTSDQGYSWLFNYSSSGDEVWRKEFDKKITFKMATSSGKVGSFPDNWK